MKSLERGTFLIAIVLIGTGVLFLVLNLIPGLGFKITWPLIFYVLAALFFIPPMIWPAAQTGLAALFIPGAVLFSLGLIFTYNVITNDWSSWAYMWILISSGTGLGLTLAAWVGKWGRTVTLVGIWLMTSSTVLFVIFALIFGGSLLKSIGPILLIALGVIFIFRSFKKGK
ncbi:MAG: hypothetical protein MUO76_13695 [Anaerolineaceae bacterium]|nr:hypothetical protein [Anaerolineaceae bacterium]